MNFRSQLFLKIVFLSCFFLSFSGFTYENPDEPSLREVSSSQTFRDQLVFPKASLFDKVQGLIQKAIGCFYKTPRRFYFLHIPKTGGTSLHTLLENQIDLKDLYPPRRLRFVNQIVKHQLVSIHCPYWACKKLDKEFENAFKVTILRHPIDRFLSALRYKRKNFPKFRNWDLQKIYEHEQNRSKLNIDLEPNSLCRFLTSDPNLTGRELLESAKKALHSFDCVLFLENFEEGLQDLCQRTGIRLEKSTKIHLNATVPEETSQELLEILKAHHDLDLELYEYAKTDLKRKDTTYQFQSPFASSQKVRQVDYEFSMALNGSGWCYRENVDRFSPKFPIYRWVMDKPANIFFNLKPGKSYHLVFYAQPLTSDTLPHVLINGKEVRVKRNNLALFSKFSCTIPKNLISEDPTEITFFSPKSYKYNEIYPGCSDDRKLSFAVEKIQIFPK